ncbi:MAG: hypothetical protein OEM24_14165 [Paracoccaceae bacterium]|nr:hypothetical protein [Paracoccaceae bacterium]
MDDRSTPEQAYRTFRGALARGEHEREWACLSDDLRRERLGMRSRSDWKDARAVALHRNHPVVWGIVHSDVREPRALPDGRVLLDLRFPLGYRGQVWMRRVPVLMAFGADSLDPVVYEHLPALEVSKTGGGLRVAVPSEMLGWIDPKDLEGVVRVEAALLWFLDDFAVGDEDSRTVRGTIEGAGEP